MNCSSARESLAGRKAVLPPRNWYCAPRRQGGKAIWVCEQEHGASPVGIKGATIERQARPAGQVGGTVAEPVHGTPVSEVVSARPRDHANAQRKVGRHVIGSSPKDVAFVDQRGNGTGEWTLIDGDHPGQSRVDGETKHLAPKRSDGLIVLVECVQVGQQVTRLRKGPSREGDR